MVVAKIFASLTVFSAIAVGACLYAWPQKGDHANVTAAAMAVLGENAVVAALAWVWGF